MQKEVFKTLIKEGQDEIRDIESIQGRSVLRNKAGMSLLASGRRASLSCCISVPNSFLQTVMTSRK